MAGLTLNLEYYNLQHGKFEGEFDLTAHIHLLKNNNVLKQETWEEYVAQPLNEAEFVFLQSTISHLNKLRFRDYDWFFQYRSE
jgi:hypothetical protein